MTKIPGGYYIKARKIQQSAIAHAPPHVREVWDWLLLQANHQNSGPLHRGQCLCTYKKIQEGLHWKIGYRKQKYTKWQIEHAMKWLTAATMVATTKTTRGMVITIQNYDYYQTPQNYECHMNATRKPQLPDTINKNDIKNERKKYSVDFEKFWEAYPNKVGKSYAFRCWKGIRHLPKLEVLLQAIEIQKDSEKWQKGYIPNPSTWLNQGRWEDEIGKQDNNRGYAERLFGPRHEKD